MVQPFTNNLEADGGGARLATVPLPTAPPMDSPTNDGQYVDFLVLGNKENFLVRAERKAILDSNTGLAHMLSSGGGGGDSKCVVRDVNRDNFETFVRYLETKFIKFNSPTHALEMLELATRFQCRQLEIYCVKDLDLNLHVDHVLEVYRALWFYNSIAPPKAPSKEEKRRSRCPRANKSNTASGPLTPEEYFAALLNNCLQLIDMYAEEVFSQEAMLALRFPELEMIVKRDALQLSSETVLLDVLARWSLEDCKRKHIDPTAENRRRALGALCYAPRYLNMSRREFDAARERIELLDPAESQLVGDILTGGVRRSAANLTPEQETLVARFRAPRPDFPLLPVQLSARSHPRNYTKKMRKAAADAERERDGPKKGCCNRLLLNCCSVFACIFD
ncbi:BTB/POZ domain-containing protein 2 [Anopheles marshallii]|uniref:BTB/POZ domain-containing protein 2 n=1 Tax=Anopheles marshallii TaxID=1521116 RepID=UPI00237B730E|nr:BTB/POZ domain-containing protein 2 [Anopheles marshallii]